MEESNPLKLELDQNEIENTQIMKLKEIIRNIFRILRVMSGKNRFRIQRFASTHILNGYLV